MTFRDVIRRHSEAFWALNQPRGPMTFPNVIRDCRLRDTYELVRKHYFLEKTLCRKGPLF